MKRLTIVTVFVFLALQFTCGNVSSEKYAENIQKTPLICKDYDTECKQAVSALNQANYAFWRHSYRIDSLLSSIPKKKHRIHLMTSSDPVNY